MNRGGRTSRCEEAAWAAACLAVGLVPLLPIGRTPSAIEIVASTILLLAAFVPFVSSPLARRLFWTAPLAVATTSVLRLATAESPLRDGTMLAAATLLAFGAWRLARSQAADEDPLVSLVVLLGEPARLEGSLLAARASEAWQIEVGTEEDENEAAYAVGESPHLLVKRDDWLFAVHDVDEPYFENRERVARYTPDWRERRVVSGHCAWLSVDLLYAPAGTSEVEAYRRIGPLLAELAADATPLGVVVAETRRMYPWEPVVESALRAEDPVASLEAVGRSAPLVVSEDDPRVVEAIRTARSRWREFVDAFERRASDEGYSVKVPVPDGPHTELRWVNVTAIENDVVYAAPGNRRTGHFRRRPEGIVRTPAGDVVDWLFEANGQRCGGFTLDVFRQVANEHGPDADAFESS